MGVWGSHEDRVLNEGERAKFRLVVEDEVLARWAFMDNRMGPRNTNVVRHSHLGVLATPNLDLR